MTTNRPLRVFLCHSSNDKPAVRELYQKLRAETWISPWLDEEELFPGMDWNLEIEKAVEAADAIIVCLSKGSITKEGYVQRELRVVLDAADYKPEGTLYIIPVRLEECEPPRRLRAWQYADYFEGQRERAFERLLISLRRRADSLELKFETPTPKIKEELVDEKITLAETSKPAQITTLPMHSISDPTYDGLTLIKEDKPTHEDKPIGKQKKPSKKPSQPIVNKSPQPKVKTLKPDALNEILDRAKYDLSRGEISSALKNYEKLIIMGEYLEDCIRDLGDALYRYPLEVDIWNTLGDAHMRANHLPEAFKAYNEAKKLIK